MALKTWRYFRTFSTEEDQFLIPDNVQGQHNEIAHRISPTNLGLLLNSQYAAHDLGFITLPRFLMEANRSFLHAKNLPRVNGHFLNWYDTRSSTPLPPFFISSVDSGNLVCSLLTLKQGCLAAVAQPILAESLFHSLRDYLAMAAEELAVLAGQTDSLAAVEPRAPSAIPMSDAVRTGASLTPSPTKATGRL